jgi:hypothetical protein
MLAEVKDLVRLLRRIAITVVGTVILAVGVVLLVAPGPSRQQPAVGGLTVLPTMACGVLGNAEGQEGRGERRR